MDAVELLLENMNTRHTDLLNSIDLNKFRYTQHKVNANCCYTYAGDRFHLTYYPYHADGSLHIRFNAGKLTHGNNLVNVWGFNAAWVKNILTDLMSGVMDFTNAPPIRFFKVSEVEINFDLIRPQKEIEELYNALRKISAVGRFKLIDTYAASGSLYFRTGKKHEDCITVKFYKKIKQLRQAGQPVQAYLSNPDTIRYNPGYDVLRMEVTLTRTWLNRLFRKLCYSYNSATGVYEEVSNYKGNMDNIGTLDDVMDLLFRKQLITEIIHEFNLDKPILPKDELMSYIDGTYNHPTNKTVKECIRYLNNDTKSKRPPTANIYKYRSDILKAGYHFLYTQNTTVKPISFEEFELNLPEAQRRNMHQYGNSDFMFDYWNCH